MKRCSCQKHAIFVLTMILALVVSLFETRHSLNQIQSQWNLHSFGVIATTLDPTPFQNDTMDLLNQSVWFSLLNSSFSAAAKARAGRYTTTMQTPSSSTSTSIHFIAASPEKDLSVFTTNKTIQHGIYSSSASSSAAAAPVTSASVTADAIVSIVIPLSGEMGNLLSSIARGLAVQQWIQELQLSLSTNLIFQDTGKTRGNGTRDLKQCFPNLRSLDLRRGNTREYDERLSQQQAWLRQRNLTLTSLHVQTDRLEDLQLSLRILSDMQKWSPFNCTTVAHHNEMDKQHHLTFPFLTVDGDAALVDGLADKYYDEFRQVFVFDTEACCQHRPHPEEIVWHFRNYEREMGARRAKKLGFEELDPNRTANELFRHLTPGATIAITSRYSSDPSIQPYMDALTNRGFQVRVIQGQTGVQDFCFLLHAQMELVGVAESTFTLWAGYLGNASKVRLYSIDSATRRTSYFFSHRVYVHYNWTNPELQPKVHFELYSG